MLKRSRYPRYGRMLYRFVRDVATRFGEDHIPLAAGAISFFTLISLIPLLLFGVLIAAYFITPEYLLQQMESLTTSVGANITQALEQQANIIMINRQILTVMMVCTGMWTGMQFFLMLEAAINMVWRSRITRSFWARRGIALAMVILVGSFMVLAWVLTNLHRILQDVEMILGLPRHHLPVVLSVVVSGIIPILLVTAIFSSIYCLLPAKRVTFRTVLPGAVFASFLWYGSWHAFSWYVHRVSFDYQFLYGSLTKLIMMLFWLYYSAIIMLLGAEISATYHQRLLAAGDAEERRVEDEPVANAV